MVDGKALIKFVGVVEKNSNGESIVKVFSSFCKALEGITSFSHIIILYWLHLRDTEKRRKTLTVIPRRHPRAPELGVFACRSPDRPNPIGLSVAELLKVEGCKMYVEEIDAEVGSPIIDIKPYLPRADFIREARVPKWALLGPKT